jgi:hypothetical protein
MWEAAKTAAFALVTKRAKEKWGMVLPLVFSTGVGSLRMPTLYCRKLLRIRRLVRTAVRISAAGLCTSLQFVKQF